MRSKEFKDNINFYSQFGDALVAIKNVDNNDIYFPRNIKLETNEEGHQTLWIMVEEY